MQADVARRYL